VLRSAAPRRAQDAAPHTAAWHAAKQQTCARRREHATPRPYRSPRPAGRPALSMALCHSPDRLYAVQPRTKVRGGCPFAKTRLAPCTPAPLPIYPAQYPFSSCRNHRMHSINSTVAVVAFAPLSSSRSCPLAQICAYKNRPTTRSAAGTHRREQGQAPSQPPAHAGAAQAAAGAGAATAGAGAVSGGR
jgi:hypothetical protein